jgi:membrane protease YdiL (CAAX protease family)
LTCASIGSLHPIISGEFILEAEDGQVFPIGIASCPPTQRTITLLLAFLLSGFVAPIVEELYFRGFLLSRMEHWGWAAPVINSFLFAVYHFYFPGNVPGIFIAFLPIAFIVRIKKNWIIGAITHSMFNLWGVFSVIAAVN